MQLLIATTGFGADRCGGLYEQNLIADGNIIMT